MRIDVFPHNISVGCHFEQPPIQSFVNQRVAIGQPLRVRNPAAEEEVTAARRDALLILPNDFLGGGVDFKNSRKRLNTAVCAKRAIVEQEDIAIR